MSNASQLFLLKRLIALMLLFGFAFGAWSVANAESAPNLTLNENQIFSVDDDLIELELGVLTLSKRSSLRIGSDLAAENTAVRPKFTLLVDTLILNSDASIEVGYGFEEVVIRSKRTFLFYNSAIFTSELKFYTDKEIRTNSDPQVVEKSPIIPYPYLGLKFADGVGDGSISGPENIARVIDFGQLQNGNPIDAPNLKITLENTVFGNAFPGVPIFYVYSHGGHGGRGGPGKNGADAIGPECRNFGSVKRRPGNGLQGDPGFDGR